MVNLRKSQGELWIVVGTRPEVIKQVPVYKTFRKLNPSNLVLLLGSGQHTSLLEQALLPFQTQLDLSFQLPPRTLPDLSELMGQMFLQFAQLFSKQKPSGILVQGDTSTSAVAAQAAFLNSIPVYHNEAGLRSYDLTQPFPEEANRKWISTVANLHFAPTELAKKALLQEGFPEDRIEVVGNTGLDALEEMLSAPAPQAYLDLQKNGVQDGPYCSRLTAEKTRESSSMSFILLYPNGPKPILKIF